MIETKDVQPALSSEAWSDLLRIPDGFPINALKGQLGVAAIALHDHPQGFSWSDVDFLSNLAAKADCDANTAEASDESGEGILAATSYKDQAETLRNHAARVAALLAPR